MDIQPTQTGLLTQTAFPVDHLCSSVQLLPAEITIVKRACSIAHRLVFSEKSLNILNYALDAAGTTIPDFATAAVRQGYQWRHKNDSTKHQRLLNLKAKDNFTILADTGLDEEGGHTDACVFPDEPTVIHVKSSVSIYEQQTRFCKILGEAE